MRGGVPLHVCISPAARCQQTAPRTVMFTPGNVHTAFHKFLHVYCVSGGPLLWYNSLQLPKQTETNTSKPKILMLRPRKYVPRKVGDDGAEYFPSLPEFTRFYDYFRVYLKRVKRVTHWARWRRTKEEHDWVTMKGRGREIECLSHCACVMASTLEADMILIFLRTQNNGRQKKRLTKARITNHMNSLCSCS
jgi:hypothetical protein